jgi:hypothetical protein
MFDFRYHVASLAAVFLALIIGIVVGVGISSGGFVSKSERSLLNSRITELQDRLNSATQRAGDLAEEQRAGQQFIQDSYTALMTNRLAGRNIAVVFVGSIDDGVRSLIEKTLSDAGAPTPIRVRSLKVPIDLGELDAVLASRPGLVGYADAGRAGDIGRELGQEFVLGGDGPLWRALSPQLVAERSGTGRDPADAVVVVRSADAQQGQTARLLAGFYAGLASQDVPAVGVQRSDAATTALHVFRRAHLSTVDDVDTLPGRIALAVLLSGGKAGAYGITDNAKDGLLPPVGPVTAPTSTSG